MSVEADLARGKALVLQPDDGMSYWQPVPANGFAHPKAIPAATGCNALSMGFQTVAPGGRIRAHAHDRQVELQICFRGRGTVVVDGARHSCVPGTVCFLGADVRHEIINDSSDDLVMLWVIAPPGLEDFFAAIGRERQPGTAPPEPFPRPDDVAGIERDTGFTRVAASKPSPGD